MPRSLGARSGLSGPSLYRHFSGKDEILATLLNEAMDELMPATVPLHGDPELDLRRAIAHHIGFALTHRHLVTVYQREVGALVDPWRRAFTRRRAQHTERWEVLLEARFPSLDRAAAAAVSQACLGMVFSVAAWPDRTASSDAVPALLEKLVHHGLGALQPVAPATSSRSPVSPSSCQKDGKDGCPSRRSTSSATWTVS